MTYLDLLILVAMMLFILGVGGAVFDLLIESLTDWYQRRQRCCVCQQPLWFWQSHGWLILPDTTSRWHGACRRAAR